MLPAEKVGEPSKLDDVSRLRALLLLVREFGVTRLALPDGTVLERPPPTLLEQAMNAEEKRPQAKPALADDDDDTGDDEERVARELARAWTKKWEGITAASGAAIPEFPGVDKARVFLGEH